MKATHSLPALAVCASLALFTTAAGGQSTPVADPGAPDRGTVTGSAAAVFGASALSRGTFHLPSAFDVPQEEGGPLWDIFPTYSPDSGLSEWGMGWQSSLSITRWRPVG